MSWGWHWRPYVPVARRRRDAAAQMAKLRKKGAALAPVEIEGRRIASTFWGEAWCDHLEKFSDYENRLPRGRTYVRNGSVCHLEIGKGKVSAKVMGSRMYDVDIKVKPLPPERWKSVKARCGGAVGSLLDLLSGRLSERVMRAVTDRAQGLFPSPREISLDCSCPDWADMCKHVAAAMYGVGARLDRAPEQLFALRGVDHQELVGAARAGDVIERGEKGGRHKKLKGDLGSVFGIELAPSESESEATTAAAAATAKAKAPAAPKAPPAPRRGRKPARPKPARKERSRAVRGAATKA